MSMGFLSDRIQRVGESATLKISAKAKQLKAEGVDVIDFSIGEPDFPTPQNIKDAGKKAIDANFTKYTANNGIVDLKNAIVKKLADDNGLTYKADEIIVSSGAKNCLFNLCMTLFNPGEEAIIPSPYWVSYPEMVILADGKPVYIPCQEKNGFRMTPQEFAAAITPKTKAVFINSPCNPTGAAYSRDELEGIVKIAVDKNIVIISDEIYEKLIYDGLKFTSVPSLSAKAKELTVLINGVSKSYSMTGWRIGYAAGSKDLIAGMSKVQSHNTSNACSISQKAAVEALTGSQAEVQNMVTQFEKRRNLGLEKLRNIKGVTCPTPKGAFYFFANFQSYFGTGYGEDKVNNAFDMAYYLLKDAHVAVVSGEAFGLEGYLRISYATSEKNIETGINRIAESLDKLKPVK
jgi:aspartate/methionine/tyrosine aminotransferase